MTDTTDLSADIHNNTLGAHLRRLWDAARSAGRGHGIWRPQLGRFVTMDEHMTPDDLDSISINARIFFDEIDVVVQSIESQRQMAPNATLDGMLQGVNLAKGILVRLASAESEQQP